jgi:3',5'-cyclic AMP phosphodiesterase CpdA
MHETPVPDPALAWTLAHLSDPHLTGLEELEPRQLLNKRALGYRSWRRHRRHEHRPEILAALVEDLHRQNVEQVAVTGDLTHLGTPRECREVADWLPMLGNPDRVTLVPGNHDAYVHEPWGATLDLWSAYMAGDAHSAGGGGEHLFPSLRVRGNLALIGLSSARPSAPLLAVGSLGARQLHALPKLLAETGRRGLCRILLIHHPPAPGSCAWRKRLTDAPRLAEVIAAEGVELVLHGHTHKSARHWLATPGGRAPAIGVRSASGLGRKRGRRAQYHLHRILRSGSEWRMQMSVREYLSPARGFAETATWETALGRGVGNSAD